MPDRPRLEAAPFSDDELDLFLTDGHHDETPVARWSVTDLGAAEWALERLGEALDEIADAEEQAAVWRSRIDEWLAAATGRPARFAEFLTQQLADFGLAAREANPKTATIKCPAGQVSTRWVGQRPVIIDEVAVLEWLDARGEVPDGAIKRRPLVSKLGDAITIGTASTGRVIAEVGCCGATVTVDGQDLAVTDGVLLACPNCGAPDPTVSSVEDETIAVAVDTATGERIDGVIVEPGHYNPTVKPNRG